MVPNQDLFIRKIEHVLLLVRAIMNGDTYKTVLSLHTRFLLIITKKDDHEFRNFAFQKSALNTLLATSLIVFAGCSHGQTLRKQTRRHPPVLHVKL